MSLIQCAAVSGKTPLAQDIRYALGRMPKARPCLSNGYLSLDTDVVEQPFFVRFLSFSRAGGVLVDRIAPNPCRSCA